MNRECKESDWKLFKKKIPVWQEKHMERLNEEYIKILKQNKDASSNFWELEKRIRNDKKHPGVIVEMSRSTMFTNILILLNDNVITIEDVKDFSDELNEEINYMLNRK